MEKKMEEMREEERIKKERMEIEMKFKMEEDK